MFKNTIVLIKSILIFLITFSFANAIEIQTPDKAGIYNIGETTARISFKDNSINETEFKIHNNTTELVTILSSNRIGTGYQYLNLENLTPCTIYNLTIVALNGINESNISKVSSFKTKCSTPAPTCNMPISKPINIGVYHITQTTARISFLDQSNNEIGFKIYDNNLLIKTLTSTSPIDINKYQYTTLTSLQQNSLHELTIEAYNQDCNSSRSLIKQFTTLDSNNTEDNIKPIITLIGESNLTIEVNSAYIDAGAIANDNIDGNITANIMIINTVDTSSIGTYTVTYDVNDSSKNMAETQTRVVNIVLSSSAIALEKIKAYALDNNNNNSIPILQDYINIGVTGINADNLDAMNDIIASKTPEEVNSRVKLDSILEELSIAQDTGSHIMGRIVSTTGTELSEVSIKVLKNSILQSTTALTSENGTFDINLSSNTIYTLTFTKNGFANQVKTVKSALEGERIILDINMISRASTQTIPQEGNLSGEDGASIYVKDLIFKDSNGNTLTFEDGINLTITPVDISSPVGLASFPGNFSGIPEGDNTASPIISYGTVEYQFTRISTGEELQLSTDTPIHPTIFIPIYTNTHPDGSAISEGDTIPLWSLNEKTGIWIQEGTGIVRLSNGSPSGFVLQANVSHFTWWNCDVTMNPAKALITVTAPSTGTALIKARTTANIGWRANTVDTVINIGSTSEPLAIPSNGEVCFWAELSLSNNTTASTTETCITATENETVTINLGIEGGTLGLTATPDNNISTYINVAPLQVKIHSTTLESNVNYIIESGALPEGVTLRTISDTVAVISGVPTESGQFSLTIKGTDIDNNEARITIKYEVKDGIAPPKLDGGYIINNRSFQHQAVDYIYLFNSGTQIIDEIDLNQANIGGPISSWEIYFDSNTPAQVDEVVNNENGISLYTVTTVDMSEFDITISPTGILKIVYPISYISGFNYRLDFRFNLIVTVRNNTGNSSSRVIVNRTNGITELNYRRDDYGTQEITNEYIQDTIEVARTARTWSEAVSYCQNLELYGYVNWRLPNQIEIDRIINGAYYNEPFNNTTYNFNGDRYNSVYWTSVESDEIKAYAIFNGDDDNAFPFPKDIPIGARCVRDQI